MRRRPTRRDLLVAIGELQHLIGQAQAANHDRNMDRFAEVNGFLEAGLRFCVKIRSFDPPIEKNLGPWGGPIVDPNQRFI